MALRLRNPRVRLHKYPFISIIYHNLTLHIIMSAVNSNGINYYIKSSFTNDRKEFSEPRARAFVLFHHCLYD